MKASAQPELLRAIGRWSLVALTINCIIGSGIFGLPAIIAGQLGRWAPLGYLVAAVGVGAIMGCFAEVASRFTEPGGPYLYAREAFGSFIGIEIGWLTWLVRLASSAASANLFMDYLGQFLPAVTIGAPRTICLTAIVAIALAVNVRGVGSGARLSNIFTVAKLVPVFVLIVAGMIFFASHGWHPGGPVQPREPVDALVLLVFAYGGFESAMIPLGEARDPRSDAPFALGAALVCCTVVFTSIQIVAMAAVPDLASTPRPLAAAAQVTMGSPGAALLTAGALFSTYGLLSANMLNVPRLTYALAREGQFPAFFAATHPRFRTPHVSIAVFAGLLWVLALAGGFRWNAVLSTVSRIFTYGAVCGALLMLRRKRSGRERFHLRGGPVFAAIGIAFCVLVGTRIGWVELLILLVTAVIAAVNWWLARRSQPAGGTMNELPEVPVATRERTGEDPRSALHRKGNTT
jgi:basic amino acid/polyamine antiporter, APA family